MRASGRLILARFPHISATIDTGANAMVNGGFAVGIAIGAAMGVATGNFGLWLALGVPLGAALGSAWQSKRKSED